MIKILQKLFGKKQINSTALTTKIYKDGFYADANTIGKESKSGIYPEYIMTPDGPIDIRTKDFPTPPKDRIEIH